MVNKKRILIVEDEKIVSKDIESSLQNNGYEVCSTTSSGEEAISLASEQKPDLILMDILLGSHINGIEAAEEIRKTSDVPIIYLTAYADDKTVGLAKHTNPSGYVLKPFEERELKAAIELALQPRQEIDNLKQEINDLLRELGRNPKY